MLWRLKVGPLHTLMGPLMFSLGGGGGLVGVFGGNISTPGFEFAQPLLMLEVQTNNQVELLAAIFILEHAPSSVSKLLVATNSKCVRNNM